jgi:hypothetical protein
MHSLPTWACWIVAAGVLLSPVLAFLLALSVEIVIAVLKGGGVPALVTLAGAGIVGWTAFRKRRVVPRVSTVVGDQA